MGSQHLLQARAISSTSRGIIFATNATGDQTAPAGSVGIGTVTPQVTLDVNGAIRAYVAHTNVAALPTISTCGTSPPAATAGSNNNSGQFTTGTATPTACTVTFATAYSNAAFCTVTPASVYAGTYYISAQSKTAFTVTIGTGTNSLKFNYTCGGSQ